MEPFLIPSLACWTRAFRSAGILLSQSWKGGQADVAVLQGAGADADLDRTIGNRLKVVVNGDIHVLQLQTTTVSAVKLPSGFGPPTSVTLYPIFKSDSDAGPAEVLIVAWSERWTT